MLLLALLILVVTRPCLVQSRVLSQPVQKENEKEIGKQEATYKLKIPRRASVKIEEAEHSAEIPSSRVLIGNRVYPLSSGPSRKGSGH